MTDDLISINNSDNNNKKVNEIKIKTGLSWKKNESTTFEFHNFDFSKKIFYHPDKIQDYKDGKRPFPTTLEIDLTNRCNHRCSFCFYAEHIGTDSEKPSLDTQILKTRLKEAKSLGTKGVSFTGGGEPTIHKDYLDLLAFAKNEGFDVGTITNGSTITERNVDVYVKNLQWIRISMAGGDKESYREIQGVDQFEMIVKNIQLLSKKKKELNSNLNIGIRTLVTPKNLSTLTSFAEMIKNLNINYFQLVPDQFSDDNGTFWNEPNTQQIFKNIKDILLPKKIKLLSTTYMSTQGNLDYPQTCYAHFFMVIITAEGDITFCKNSRGETDFNIGNINFNSFSEIWNGKKTKEIEKWVKPNNCGLFCKHMAMNTSMEDIIHPDSNMSPNFVG